MAVCLFIYIAVQAYSGVLRTSYFVEANVIAGIQIYIYA